MLTSREKMFADEEESNEPFYSQDRVNQRTVQELDQLALKIADGDVDVHTLNRGPEIDGYIVPKDTKTTLEVTYSE